MPEVPPETIKAPTPAADHRSVLVRVWKQELHSRYFLVETILTVLFLLLSIRICAYVMLYIELRKGVELPDPVLASFQPYNLRWPIFAVLWTTMLFTVYHLLHYPRYFIIALQAGGILLIFRTIALALVPLEPMRSIIPLQDPIVESLGAGKLIVKDLFFSGHTATMALCVLASRRFAWKMVCLASTIAVAMGVILQHVHYSGDVYAAPFFAYASWRIALLAHRRFRKE